MANTDVLEVKERTTRGSRESQRLRATGLLPAVLYGHGEDPVNLTVKSDQLRGVLRHGGQVVDLSGAAEGQALVQDTQWDTFGSHLLHVDLLRVKAGQLLKVEVAVELKGEAIGAREGGVVEQMMHEVEIEAAPAAIPEKLHIDITEMQLNGSMSAGDIIDMPEGAKLVTPAEAMVVHCVPPAEEPEPEDIAAEAGEPELVGGKADDEDKDNEGGDS